MVDHRPKLDDLSERARLRAHVIGQGRLRGLQRRRGGCVALLQPRDFKRVGDRRRTCFVALDDVDLAQPEDLAGPGHDRDRHRLAVAMRLQRPHQPRVRLGPDPERNAIDDQRDIGVEIALRPERIQHRVEIGRHPARQGFAIGRRILPQAIEQGSILQRARQPLGVIGLAEIEFELVGQGGRTRRRRLVLLGEETEHIQRRQIESPGRFSLQAQQCGKRTAAAQRDRMPCPTPEPHPPSKQPPPHSKIMPMPAAIIGSEQACAMLKDSTVPANEGLRSPSRAATAGS